MSNSNLYSTPKFPKKRIRTGNLTFNKKNTHHDLYDKLTEVFYTDITLIDYVRVSVYPIEGVTLNLIVP